MRTTPTENIPETPELGTPCYNGQKFDSQWCSLLRGSTVSGKFAGSNIPGKDLKFHVMNFSGKPSHVEKLIRSCHRDF